MKLKFFCPLAVCLCLLGRAGKADVLINEIMYHPSSEKIGEEYIELFNSGTNAVSLAGWRLSKGVAYTFSNDAAIGPGQYLVLAASLSDFSAKYPNVTNVVGGWQGSLKNSGEEIQIENAFGQNIDSVNYADEGDWAVRQRGPLDNGHRGWEWLAEHDGLGKSLELAAPGLPNNSGQNWAASLPLNGTPGARNSVFTTNGAPLISDVQHKPTIPSATDPVTITARIIDESLSPATVTLFSRNASSLNPPAFVSGPMFDDGQHNDGVAGDGIYGAILDPAPAMTVVEFYVRAVDGGGLVRTWPASARQENGTFAQTANALYQVDEFVYGGKQPLLRLIMTERERDELASFDIRQSNAEMNGTLLSSDGTGLKVRYNVGIRVRGAGSRGAAIPSYRVNIPSDNKWNGVSEVNLNAQFGYSQVAGSALAQKAGIVFAHGRAVQVRVNSLNLASTGFPQFGSYALMEVLNSAWAANHIPADPEGNIYTARRVNGQDLADLTYLGTNWQTYAAQGYEKSSNGSENDWNDLIQLTAVLSNAPTATYLQQVSQVANIEEWIRYFAIHSILGSGETSLGTGFGDDYDMYRGIVDPRFLLVPHDFDTILNQGQGPQAITSDLFLATATPAINRFLRHPEIVPLYYSELRRLIQTTTSTETLNPLLDELLSDYVPAAVIDSMKNYARDRNAWVLSQLPASLTITTSLTQSNGYYYTTLPNITLNGTADAVSTRSVRVNGSLATWNPITARWNINVVSLAPGINRILAQAFNRDGVETARTTIDVYYNDNSTVSYSGTLSSNTTLLAANGPYVVSGNLIIPAGRTLTILAGTTLFFQPGASLTVQGQLFANGTETSRIRLTRMPAPNGVWNGISFINTPQSNRLSYVDMEFAGGTSQSINVQDSTLYINHARWSGVNQTIIELQNSSLHVRNSVFPSILNSETIHGNVMPANGFVIVEENIFGNTTGYSDVIDFTGGRRPGPILQVLNNIFTGGGDDALDLDGTDTHVEGNVFMNFIQDAPRDSTANGIATDNQAEITAVRNIFYNNDHAALLKVGSFLTAHNNTIIGSRIAAINFDEPERPGVTPGRGAYLDGNIIWNNDTNFQHLYVNDPVKGTIDLRINRSIIPGTQPWPGIGNLNDDPRLSNTNPATISPFTLTNDFRLVAGSPALGSGPNGLDMGALVPGGASISGEPEGTTASSTVTLLVGGPGITHYRFSLNNSPYSSETSITNPIVFSGLTNGSYSVQVIGKNSAAVWQVAPTVSKTWTVDSAYSGALVINEILARNASAVAINGEFPDLIELYNGTDVEVDLGDMTLSDTPADPSRFVFPPGTILGPGQYLVMIADNENGPGLHTGFGLNQRGSGLYLYSAGEVLLDSVVFGPQAADWSIGRFRDGWGLARPTFGGPNMAQRTGRTELLVINEWLAEGAAEFADDFIELYNADSLPVPLEGLFLTDAIDGAPRRHAIAPLSFIPAFGHLAFIADGNSNAGPDHLDFSLSPEQGTIGLFSVGGNIDCVIYGPQKTGVSEGRKPSGASLIAEFGPETQTSPTPNAPNPGLGGERNVTNITVNLVAITNIWRYETTGRDLGNAWTLPGYDDSAWPSGPALLYNENNISVPFRNTFLPFTDPQQITFYFRTTFLVESNLDAFTLRARAFLDDGAVFYLNGNEVLRVRMPTAEQISYSTLATGTPPDGDASVQETYLLPTTGLLIGTNTLAVEVHQFVPTSTDIVWGMGLDATALVTNVSSMTAVLSEVLANNRTITNGAGKITDFIEIYNPQNSTVNLSNQSLTDDAEDPRRWVFPHGSVLAAGAYLLIACDPDMPPTTNNASAPFNTGFGLNSDGDAVYLFDTPARGGALLDSVSFGVQAADHSIGRPPGGAVTWQLNLPTPGSVNIAASTGPVQAVKINEWMANPRSGDDWIELYNPNNQPVEISGCFLTDALDDPTKSAIPPLSFIGRSTNGYAQFIADNQSGGNHVEFKLDGDGEAIGLFSSTGALIDALTFEGQDEDVSEGRLPDGSTNITRFASTASPEESNHLPLRSVVINEALTHTDLPLEDAIELFNTTTEAIDISGWFISDSNEDLRKFRIPPGTVIPPLGFVVLYENQFNPDPGIFPSFALSSARGDQVHLSQSDGEGNLTGYRNSVKFGAARNGIAFGRYETSVGFDFPSLTHRTFGADAPASIDEFRNGLGEPNAEPLVGPVVITEVLYHPADLGTNDNVGDEFIELRNISSTNVALFHPDQRSNTWRLRDAVDFDFPRNLTLPPGMTLVIVSFDPFQNTGQLQAFRNKYGVDPGAVILGPYRGKLDNSSDSVELYLPDTALPGQAAPYVLTDKVKYEDSSPWPGAADTGTNYISLHRRTVTGYGNDPANWFAGTPTPGSTTAAATMPLPTISVAPAGANAAVGESVTLTVQATGAEPLSYQWRLNGEDILGAIEPVLNISSMSSENEGSYSVRVTNPAGAAWTTPVGVYIRSAPEIIIQPSDQIVAEGGAAGFRVGASGTPPLIYRWFHEGTFKANETNFGLTIRNVQSSDQGRYSLVVSNAYGRATSSIARLTIQQPPAITEHPVDRTVLAGSSVTLTSSASGSPPLLFQWRFNGIDIVGENSSSLSLSNLQPSQSGLYSVKVSNAVGFDVSDAAQLTVVLPPVISITATDAVAAETGNNGGEFQVIRSGSTNFEITVGLSVSGDALNGGDYNSIPTSLTLEAGIAAAIIPVNAINDGIKEGTERIQLQLVSGAGYSVGSSNTATVSILDDDNLPPTVSITSPLPEGFYPQTPTNILLQATAHDNDGTISKVQFFNWGTNLLGEVTGSSGNLLWTNATPGSNSLTALAIDDLGGSTLSAPVRIYVNIPPVVTLVSPLNGSAFPPGTNFPVSASARDDDGSIKRVDLYHGAQLIGTFTNGPYGTNFSISEAGVTTLFAVATDNDGMSRTSAPATVVIKAASAGFSDMFGDRGDIVGYGNLVAANSSGATREIGEPRPYASGSRTMWLRWVAPASGLVVLDTLGSSFDTVLAVFTNNPPYAQGLGNLRLLAENDDSENAQSQLSFNVQEDVPYQIRVEGFGPSDYGNIIFHQSLATRAPKVVVPPQNMVVRSNGTVTLRATVNCLTSFGFQWRLNGTNIAGGTITAVVPNFSWNVSLTVSNVNRAKEGLYSVEVGNAFGGDISAPGTVEIGASPVVTAHPQPLTLLEGETAVFSVSASGALPMSYRWRRNNSTVTNIILHANTCLFTIANVGTNHAGNYDVAITNGVGSASSASARALLTVLEDTDRDGMPNVWEAQYGFNSTNANDGSLDSDNDGLTNLQEYRSGTDPQNSASRLTLALTLNAGAPTLNFQAVSNKTYAILYKSTLADPNWIVLMEVAARPSNRLEVLPDPSPAPSNRFYRLVTPKLP